MRASTTTLSKHYLRQCVALALTAQLALSIFNLNGYSQDKGGREQLRSGSTRPRATRGAIYPPAKPSDRIPNADQKGSPVPTGPKRGDMRPANDASDLKQITDRGGKTITGLQPTNDFVLASYRAPDKPDFLSPLPPPLFFKQYNQPSNLIPGTSGCCPEISPAENGQTIMITANTWMSLSENGGGSYTQINPTTIFPQSDGGFCCDQVIVYIPQIDMFVWLLQYWSSGGKNRIRMAAQTTAIVRSSNGLSWTYWDFVSDAFDKESSFDYNDVGFGRTNLWWTSQNGTGRVVVRVPLQQIAAKGVINYQYTAGTDALWSHLTQNATNRVFWAGHINNSQMRVYDMIDGNNFYSWRTVNINSWPNNTNKANCPDGTDFMPFEAGKHYVFGNTLQGGNVWFAWLASSGGGFPRPHVQIARINPSTWTLASQSQVWNRTIAFQDAYLSTNSRGEVGMEIAFGGDDFYPSSAVGVWGDFIVYYPRLSTRCPGRWGDYNHSRRAAVNAADWIATGYTNEKNSGGSNIVIPHYIRFGR